MSAKPAAHLQILDQMDFKPVVKGPPRLMDPRIFFQVPPPPFRSSAEALAPSCAYDFWLFFAVSGVLKTTASDLHVKPEQISVESRVAR